MDSKVLSRDMDSEDNQLHTVTLLQQESLVQLVEDKIQEEYLNKRRCMVEWEEGYLYKED
jgi:hypothetical protein